MTGPDPRKPSLTRRAFVQATVCGGAAGLVAAAEEKPPAPAFLAGSDWPMYRHDPALSAASPIRGGLAEAPRVTWSLDLGGPHVPSESVVVRDVTGDGRDEFLTLTAASVTCRDNRGQFLWKLDNFLNPTILDILDFAGDGSRGILLTTTRAGKVDTYMVSGRTGQAVHLWLDENNFGGHTRVGKLLPGVAGVQIAATASGQTPPAAHGGEVRLVSFEGGLERPHFRVRQHVTGVFYSPLILIADLDGDGHEEVVVISHEQVWAFDPMNGRRTFYAAYAPSIRTYMATVAVVKLESTDACPALVMMNPSLPGLKAVCQDGKTFARELWKVVVGGKEDQYQKHVTVVPAGTSLVYDLDEDGHYLVLASIKNEHGDGATHLMVFDARTGRRLAELPDAQVLAADDLDGDGKQELLLERGSELSICRWKAGELQTVWHQADVLPVLCPLSLGGDLRLTSGSSAIAKGNTAVWREKVGSTTFLLRFPDGVHGCRLGPAGLAKGQAITEHEALGNLPAPRNPSERVVWDGAKLVTLIDGREVYRYVPPAPTTYLAPPPLVADLSGKRRTLVRDSASNYLLCPAEGKKERVFLDRPYEIPEPVADATGAGLGPLVCDVDGDGDNEVVVTVTDRRGRPACVLPDGNGKEKRRLELPPGMTTLNRGPTGRLGPKLGRWLLLRMSGEGPDYERLDGARLEIGRPQPGGVALEYDKPWDGPISHCTTVIKDGDKYRMYYRGKSSKPGYRYTVCYAESPDAVHWTRPELGLVEIDGSTANNVVLLENQPLAPFLDTRPGVPAAERFKGNAFVETRFGAARDGLLGSVSADGLRWKPVRKEPIVLPHFKNNFDSQNVMFWSEAEQQYVLHARQTEAGFRAQSRSAEGRRRAVVVEVGATGSPPSRCTPASAPPPASRSPSSPPRPAPGAGCPSRTPGCSMASRAAWSAPGCRSSTRPTA